MNNRTFLAKLLTVVKNLFIRILAGGIGFYIAYTIITMMADEIKRGVFKPTQFFGYFTMESGSFTAAVMVLIAFIPTKWWRLPIFDYLRGMATLYMIIVLFVYHTLESPLGTWKIDAWSPIHVLAPFVLLALWFAFLKPAPENAKWWWPLSWMVYPLVFASWNIYRGTSLDHWYPYGFLDVTANGWPYVIGMVIGLAVGVAILGYALLIPSFYVQRKLRKSEEEKP